MHCYLNAYEMALPVASLLQARTQMANMQRALIPQQGEALEGQTSQAMPAIKRY